MIFLVSIYHLQQQPLVWGSPGNEAISSSAWSTGLPPRSIPQGEMGHCRRGKEGQSFLLFGFLLMLLQWSKPQWLLSFWVTVLMDDPNIWQLRSLQLSSVLTTACHQHEVQHILSSTTARNIGCRKGILENIVILRSKPVAFEYFKYMALMY